jgi:hypothetical protein
LKKDKKKKNVAKSPHFLLAIHSATAVDNLSGNIRRQVTGKEECDFGHIFRLSTTTEWYLLLPFLTEIIRDRFGHIGGNEAGSNAV